MDAQDSPRDKRNAIGLYANSGMSQYVVPSNISDNGSSTNHLLFSEGTNFPVNWTPRYTLYEGRLAVRAFIPALHNA